MPRVSNAIERLRAAVTGWDDPTGEEERLADVAAVEALYQAAKRVDDLSEGPIHDWDALWSACEELHRCLRRVEAVV